MFAPTPELDYYLLKTVQGIEYHVGIIRNCTFYTSNHSIPKILDWLSLAFLCGICAMFVHDGPLLVTRTSQALAGKLAVKLMQTDAYAKRVQALVVDEAHCILEWYVKRNKDIPLSFFSTRCPYRL